MNHKTTAALPISTRWKNLRSRLLEGLSLPDRESILEAGTPRRFPANSVVTDQGAPANEVFLLITGRARHFFLTEDGRKIIFNWLVPGDIFGGYAALATSASHHLGTETVKDSDVLVWDRVTVRGFVARYPRLLDNAVSILAEYLTWHLAAHVALTCYSARRRVAQVVVGLANAIGQKVLGGIELEVTNEELALAANVTPFTASRLMGQWEREGALVKSRRKILLRSPERLFVDASLTMDQVKF